MESLTFAGIPTALFLDPPSSDLLARFGELGAIGVAGRTRSLAPTAMENELKPVFEAFARLRPPIVHYKTCSTFDSTPEVGSIGRAIDVGARIFDPPYVPLVVGAPALRRFCAFGNLFASSGLESDIYRLDRHPTMSRHPITPMDEADIRVHLGRQTDRPIGLMDTVELRAPDFASRFEEWSETRDILLFDTVSEEELTRVGELVWGSTVEERTLFAAGSSGLEYALVSHWRATGELDAACETTAVDPVERIVVVSGSCSPVTAEQIEWAGRNGFAVISLDTPSLVGSSVPGMKATVEEALKILAGGKSVVLHACQGPDDPRIPATLDRISRSGSDDPSGESAERIGLALGTLMREILVRSGVRRGATTGGDTSYYVARALGAHALEAVAPVDPGSPLCRVHTESELDGIELTFKGGQVGTRDFFARVLGRGI